MRRYLLDTGIASVVTSRLTCRAMLFTFAVFVLAAAGLGCAEFLRWRTGLRAQRFKLVLAEVEKGNYYAWHQALTWYEDLSVPEQQRLEFTMVAYAINHKTVSAKLASPGPPPHQPDWATECHDIVTGLPWRKNLCRPAYHYWPVCMYLDPDTGRPWVRSKFIRR